MTRSAMLRARVAIALLTLAACSDAHTADPAWLSTQGLYKDMVTKQVVTDALEYEPDYALWSDGIQKRRWLLLPPGEVIDTSDMDHWSMPVGTKLFKEFSRYGQLLETRLVERIGDSGRFERDYKLATYVWTADQQDARETTGGVPNLHGTDHDVPAQKFCRECHRGEPGGVLGVSALQLSRSGMLTSLARRDVLTQDPERTFSFPGDEVVASAAGYLHANCGHCHSSTGLAPGDMHLRFMVGDVDRPIEQSELYTSTLNQRITEWKDHPEEFQIRVVPGEPERSALYFRMTQRGQEQPSPNQMPPLATEREHLEGVALVKAWIASLPRSAATDGDSARGEQGSAPVDAGVPAQEQAEDDSESLPPDAGAY